MFGVNRQEEPQVPQAPKLSPSQALGYWQDAARALKGMLNQIDVTTPATEHMDAMVEEMREAATAHLIAANALVGHYLMLASEQATDAMAPSATPVQRAQHQGQGQSFVPPSRQAAMPGAGHVRQQQSAGAW